MTKHILVFSDPHGRIPLLLRLVWQFQRERGVRVDTVLVTGDLGVWPDLNRLDSSTRKFCRQEPAELSFLCFNSLVSCDNSRHKLFPAPYLRRATRLLQRILPEIDARIVFVGGNHEDYEYLELCRENARNGDESAESPLIPVESSGLLWWLPPGEMLSLAGVAVAGLSGIDAEADGRDPGRYHSGAVLDEDDVLNATLGILDAAESKPLDIFLSHDGLPDAVKAGKGSARLVDSMLALNPRYHFFGHYHRSIAPQEYSELLSAFGAQRERRHELAALRTTGMHINKLAFKRGTDQLRDRVMCQVQASTEGIAAEFVDDDWIKGLSPKSVFQTN